MKFSRILFFVASLTIFVGCKKDGIQGDVINDEVAGDMANLKVPAGFTWTGQTTVKVNVKAPSGAGAAQGYTVKFYDANPFEGGQLIGQGAVTKANAFVANLTVGTMVKDIYMLSTSSIRSTSMSIFNVLPNMSIDLASVAAQSVDISQMENPVSPDCTTGCTTQIGLTNNANITVEDGKTVCVSGSNLTFNVTFGNGGGILRVCGTGLKIQNLNNNANQSAIEIIVTSGSELTFTNLNLNRANNIVTNYGTIMVPGLSVGGQIVNYGNLTTTGDYNINNENGGLDHKNYGIININSSFNINNNRTFINEGKVYVKGNLAVNSGATLTNKCFLSVEGTYSNNHITNNYGFIKVNNRSQFNSNSDFNQYGGAMFTTIDLHINSRIQGNGSSSLIKVSNGTIINSSGSIKGFIQYCDQNGIETNNGTISHGATLACDLYIPVTNCNGEGNGTSICPDADGDGVCDADDCFPNDPTKAFCNAVPAGTIAFEDNFPYAGDYDLNDVLVEYNYNVITNADNKVVKVDAVYKLRATGGANKNGFAVQFPVERSKVSNVSGATLEAGQSKAVLVIFKDMRAEMNVWNTFKGQAIAPEKVYNVSFDISNGPTLAEFGLNFYNPFIWNNGRADGNGRGYETHLPGQQPTDLANVAIFGTGMDATQPGTANTYITKNNRLPWGIHIPARFDYAVEKVVITQAHLKFATWVQSGGTEFADWYMNKPDYRNSANLFVW